MTFDPKIYRNSKDGIGSPADDAATDTTTPWTLVSLMKGLINTLTVTGGTFQPSFTDDSAHTVGTTKTLPVAGTYRSTRDAVDDGDGGTLAMTAKRGLYVSPESPLGDSLVDDTNDRLNVGLIASQNGVDGGAGAVSAKTVRTATASDSPDIPLLSTISTALTTVNTSVNTVNTTINTQSTQSKALDTPLSDVVAVLREVADNTEMLESLLTAINQSRATSATVGFVTAVSTSRTLLNPNMARRGVMLVNTDVNAVLVKYGDTASSTSYSVRIPYQGYWEMPRPTYCGRVDAIWEAVGSGGLTVTEF